MNYNEYFLRMEAEMAQKKDELKKVIEPQVEEQLATQMEAVCAEMKPKLIAAWERGCTGDDIPGEVTELEFYVYDDTDPDWSGLLTYTYKFIEGMTWSDLINDGYYNNMTNSSNGIINNYMFSLDSSSLIGGGLVKFGIMFTQYDVVDIDSGLEGVEIPVHGDDPIVAGRTYYLRGSSSGGFGDFGGLN
jgi:hypothetical protein